MTPRLVDALAEIAETNRDDWQWYRLASENVQDRKLRGHFNQLSDERLRFSSEIDDCIHRLTGESEAHHSALGRILMRGLRDIRGGLFDTDSLEKTLSDTVSLENASVGRYRAVLGRGLPATVAPVLTRQYHQIVAERRVLRHLKSKTERERS
jgi:uncharacterized protein (TIGR02284 family)